MSEETSEGAKGRPGHHGGGTLKSGNTKNVGRKPDEIRALMREGLVKAIPKLIGIASGTMKVSCRDMFGNEYERKPTPKEMIAAAAELGRMGLGTKFDITSGDEPIKAYINVDDSRM